jgi:hypothetical protein
MSSPTEASFTLEMLPARSAAVRGESRPVSETRPSGFWRRRLAWIDDLVVPHWGPEGDPSAAVRARES